MAPLAVDPEALDGAGAAVVSAGEGLGAVISTLSTALSGTVGMAGDDPAGGALGRSYDGSASKLLEAMAATRNGLCRIGDGMRMSAHNYSVAEAMSNIAGHGDPLPVPPSTGSVPVGSAPSAVGNGSSAPAGWGWVANHIGMIWPTGDSARLHAAAAAWSAAGTEFLVNEKFGVAGPLGVVRAQQIPEGEAIVAALTGADHGCTAVSHQCVAVAAQLSTYGAKVDEVHAAILDLLARICDPLTGLKEVWDFLTDKDEDEIKEIANDIRIVVDAFTAEVDALRHQIGTVLSEAAEVVTTMSGYAAREWSQFLHGTPVGRAIDQVGQFGKGFGEEVGGLVESIWDYGPVRAAIDPDGSQRSWKQLADGMAPLVGLGGEHAAGVGQAWKDLGKEVTHWDEWQTNPAEAAGKSTFDIATLFAPGGIAGAAGKGGRAAADTATTAGRGEAAASRALGDTAAAVPHPPRTETPPVERPPPPKPASAPPDSSLPHGPTEAAPPMGHPGGTGTDGHAPGGGGASHDSAPAALAERLDPVNPREESGDGWHRLPDEPRDPNYGEPLLDHWSYSENPADPSRMSSDAKSLMEDPDAPFGRDDQGHAYTQQQYEERFNKLGPEGRHWYNYASADGAVPGTKVAFTESERFEKYYGVYLDRVGDEEGSYLAVMEDGEPASWEQRALHVDSLSKSYHAYVFDHLPEGWKIEISEIEPAVGQPGGALQVRIIDDIGEVMLVKKLREFGVLR